MPILPSPLERLLFLRLNQAPGPLLDVFNAVAFRIVLAALRLGVFDTLYRSPMTSEELAQAIAIDRRGARMLLDALQSFRYVQVKAGRYRTTAMTDKWLVRSSPSSVAAGLEYWGAILEDRWDDLETTFKRGAPETNLYAWIENQPEVSQHFQAWMIAIARLVASEIVRKTKLPRTARRLIDVGGGHGEYSIAFCRKRRRLRATIFDSPAALQSARANIAAAGLEDRVQLQAGSFLTDNLGADYDAALLFNIVHGFSQDQNIDLLRRVALALNPGGTIAIVEQVLGKAPGPVSDGFAQVLGVSYYHLLGGQIYAYEDIAGWLVEAGFGSVQRTNLLKAPGNSIITARKTAAG